MAGVYLSVERHLILEDLGSNVGQVLVGLSG